MSSYKIGDKVKITGSSENGVTKYIGKTGKTSNLAFEGEWYVRGDKGEGFGWYADSSLEFAQSTPVVQPAPAFAVGARVRTTQDSRPSWLRGREGVIEDRWIESDRQCGWYVDFEGKEGKGWAFEADELELLPEPREPKAGEVWEVQRRPMYITTDREDLLTPIHLETHEAWDASVLSASCVLSRGNKFLAESLAAYFAQAEAGR